MNKLQKAILKLGGLVEDGFNNAIRSVEDRNPKLAQRVIEADAVIDRMERAVEEECLDVLALQQPVAQDLRFIVAVLKINSNLQRIGELAVNIAELAVIMSRTPELQSLPYDMPGMARIVRRMLTNSLNALVHRDAQMAEEVQAMDDQIDTMYRNGYQIVERRLEVDPSLATQMIQLLNASRHLERIADHAVNIAQDVIYMVRGELSRPEADRRLLDTGT